MGKKKKSKANKLLKMSDEERARYLQHKAEQEEEAKRRRAQLVKGWMMKKMKREQAFARLNLAKIQTFWHNFLRTRKVGEMREDVGHLKEWLDFILTLKNRIINNLLFELEEAEMQYSYNFKMHSIQIDKLIDFNKVWVDELQILFEEERDQMIDEHFNKIQELQFRFKDNSDYLKTIIFRRGINDKSAIRKEYEGYLQRSYEFMKNKEESLRLLAANRETACAILWRRIGQTVRQYVKRTDARRHHLAELRKLDAESAIEISENQERTKKLEKNIVQLKAELRELRGNQQSYFDKLKKLEREKNDELKIKRKNLMKSIQFDKEKIKVLTVKSNETLNSLNETLNGSEHCVFLFSSCKKYETVTENLNMWMAQKKGVKYPYFPPNKIATYPPSEETEEFGDDFILDFRKMSAKSVDTKKIITKFFTRKRGSAPSRLSRLSSKIRPETSVSKKSTVDDQKEVVTTLNRVVIQSKPSSYSESVTSNVSQDSTGFSAEFLISGIDVNCFGKLENLWKFHSKVVVDIRDLKDEKKKLQVENEHLKHLLRFVLETVALRGGGNGILKSNSDSSSSVSSSSSQHSFFSATLRSIY